MKKRVKCKKCGQIFEIFYYDKSIYIDIEGTKRCCQKALSEVAKVVGDAVEAMG